MAQRAKLLAAAVLAVALPASAAEEGTSEDSELPQAGAEAPPFSLPVYNSEASGAARAGTMLLVGEDSEDPATKVIVVSFLASHCKPCRKELPVMQQLHQKYRDQGLRIIGVAIDSEPEGQKVMAQLLAEAKITFPVVKDQYNLTARRYLGNKVPLPSVFVLDKGGKIQLVSRGYSEEISKKLFDALARGLGVPVSLETPANPAEKGVTRSTRSKKSSKEPAKRGVETKK